MSLGVHELGGHEHDAVVREGGRQPDNPQQQSRLNKGVDITSVVSRVFSSYFF